MKLAIIQVYYLIDKIKTLYPHLIQIPQSACSNFELHNNTTVLPRQVENFFVVSMQSLVSSNSNA